MNLNSTLFEDVQRSEFGAVLRWRKPGANRCRGPASMARLLIGPIGRELIAKLRKSLPLILSAARIRGREGWGFPNLMLRATQLVSRNRIKVALINFLQLPLEVLDLLGWITLDGSPFTHWL
jgi:hypothetical protein